MIRQFALALEMLFVEKASPDHGVVENSLRVALNVQVITELVALNADRQIDDHRLHGFLVCLFQCAHAPAAIADEERSRILVIGNDGIACCWPCFARLTANSAIDVFR